MKKDMPLILYRLLQFTWGLPQSMAGLLLYLFFYKNKHFRYRNAIITVWSDGADCLSLGPFVFVSGDFLPQGPSDQSRLERILAHEYGHSLQSLILGPLYLPVIGIPSIIWCRVPYFGKPWRRGHRSYYSFFTERSADRLGGVTKNLPGTSDIKEEKRERNGRCTDQ